MIVSFLNFFMKTYVVGTHCNHIVDKILICYHNNSFYGEISKEFLWMPFLLGNRFTKDSSQTQQERKNN